MLVIEMKTNKSPVFGIKKSEDHCFFLTEITREAINNIRNVLHEISFNQSETSTILSPLGSFEDNYSRQKYTLKVYQDRYFFLCNDAYKVEIFFGKEIAIFSVFTKIDKQEDLTNAFFKHFYWEKNNPRSS